MEKVELLQGIRSLEKEFNLPDGYIRLSPNPLKNNNEWEDLKDGDGNHYPNYERHTVAGMIRNKNTKRVLRPNKTGRVNVTRWDGLRVQKAVT